MVQTRNVAKRQKTEECTSSMESVMFNSDSLFRIASYLPAEGLLDLALTCRRFSIAQSRSNVVGGDESLSLIEETARRIVHDIATEEEMAALPRYDGENWLYKYSYLRLLRVPLTFDQLVGGRIDYVEGNKSRVRNHYTSTGWASAFSNNIMMAGKHYVSFEACDSRLSIGIMRPGEAMQSAKGLPLMWPFYNHFTQRNGSVQYNSSLNCCMYRSYDGYCLSSDWGGEGDFDREEWDGMEELSGSFYTLPSHFEIGMLLDLDEGTLSVYKNGRKLGVMKRGLAGHYCWVVSLAVGGQVRIKRGTVPPAI